MIELLLTIYLQYLLPYVISSPSGEELFVAYREGAVWACTVYELQKADPPYTPRHCWSLDEESTFYFDDWAYIRPEDKDWKVWAEISYPKGGTVEYIETDRIEIHR